MKTALITYLPGEDKSKPLGYNAYIARTPKGLQPFAGPKSQSEVSGAPLGPANDFLQTGEPLYPGRQCK